jgi:hypothetical protein
VLNANAFENLRGPVVHSDRKSDVVLTHRRLQQRVRGSVEPEPLGDAIELGQCLAESGRRSCGRGMSVQRFG